MHAQGGIPHLSPNLSTFPSAYSCEPGAKRQRWRGALGMTCPAATQSRSHCGVSTSSVLDAAASACLKMFFGSKRAAMTRVVQLRLSLLMIS